MKACFIFQRRFTPVAHKIALELKRSHGVTEFCGYVYLRTGYEFLKQQTDIAYTSLLLDEDIHNTYKNESVDWKYLNEFERTYGIPYLWPYISIDRIIRYGMAVREYPHDTPPYTHEEMARILQVKAKAITSFLEKEKPDLVYLPVISAMGNMLIYFIAKKMGITVVVGAETRISQGYILSDNYKNFSRAERRFQELKENPEKSPIIQQAAAYLETFKQKPTTYLYVMNDFKKAGTWSKIFTWFLPRNLFASIKWFATLVIKNTFSSHQKDYTDESPLAFFIDKVRRKSRLIRGYGDLYDPVDDREDFAYYPLHVEPEIATLLLAPYWIDQVNLIKQIAQSLPLHFKLYVKEHPAMVGYRPRRYYQELKKIPNVKLIEPNTSSYHLIRNCKLITTISGTAGWEGLLLGKPVITFGDVYYNTISMTRKCDTIGNLPFIVKDQLERFQYNERELVCFIAALLEDSTDIQLHEMWEKGVDPTREQKNIALFCNLLAKEFHGRSLTTSSK